MLQKEYFGFAKRALMIGESITHSAKMRVEQLNAKRDDSNKIIDLSIGTLDTATDSYVDNGVVDFIKNQPAIIHQFAPVKGFDFLLKAISKRIKRFLNIDYDPATEIMVTPGGIKGAIAVVFKTLLNSDDEVIVPLPNWPHYADMITLHGGTPIFIQSENYIKTGLNPLDLDRAITNKTKMIILGDCINPTGKVYTSEEFQQLSNIIAKHNIQRKLNGLTPIYVLYDCPYEAHILENRPQPLPAISVNGFHMRDVVIAVTGPGKTYGMHGDRIGYIYAPKLFIDVAANVQVNLNSFAGTYGQIACYYAMHEPMDQVAVNRATIARQNLLKMVELLRSYNLSVHTPQGGYFIFVDISVYADQYKKYNIHSAEQFLLEKAGVATISGTHFAEGYAHADSFKNCVRMNCGRDMSILTTAAIRIKNALEMLKQ